MGGLWVTNGKIGGHRVTAITWCNSKS